MTVRRTLGLGLMIVAGAVFAYTSGSVVYVVVLCAVAMIGLPGRLCVEMTRSRQGIASLGMALIFSLVWRLAPFDEKQVTGFVGYSLSYACGQYFLALMTAQFFLHRAGRLPASMALYGVIVMICGGNIFATGDQDSTYQLLSLAFVALVAAYLGMGGQVVPGRRGAGRAIAGAILLGAVMVGAWAGSRLLNRYETALTRLLAYIRLVRPAGGVQFADGHRRLGSLAEMKASDRTETVLRVFSERAPGYLRAATFDVYARSQWSAGGQVQSVRPSGAGGAADVPRPDGQGELFVIRGGSVGPWRQMDVWPVVEASDAMFAPLGTAAVLAPTDELTVSDCEAIHAPELASGVNYWVLAPTRRRSVAPTPRIRARCLAVPLGIDPRVRALADRIFADAKDTAAKIAAVEAYFHDNYQYRLGITVPLGRDPLTFFLLNRPPAHCEYFATAAAVLLRLAQVPTRYVTGLVVEERNPHGGYWMARARDAHAWVEAWDQRTGRWMLVEATPAAGVPDGRSTGSLGYIWDDVKLRLQELSVVIRLEGLRGLARWLWARLLALGRLLVTTILGLIITALVAVLIARRLLRIRRAKLARKPPTARVIGVRKLLARMDRRVGKYGLVRGPTETLHQFAARILSAVPADAPRETIAAWYRQCAQVRYGPSEAHDDLDRLKDAMPTPGR